MKILPKVVQTLITSSPDATRVRDGLTTAVQPTLDFLNNFFKAQSDNSLQILRNIKTLGSAIIGGTLTVNGDTVLNGNVSLFPRTGNGVVIVPKTTGDPPFYITNPANTDALVLANLAGTFYAVSFVSRAGIKNEICVGEYWNTAPGSGVNYQYGRAVSNVQNNALGVTPFIMKWTHAGSVVGMTLNEAGPNTAQHQVIVQKNGSTIYTWVAGAGGNNATFWATFTKGQIPFAAGDTMTVFGNVASTANTQTMVHFTLEMAA